MFLENSFCRDKTFLNAIYAIAFTLITIIVIVMILFAIFKESGADDVTQSTVIANSNPYITSITTALSTGGTDISSLSVVENTTTSLYIHGNAEDANGCSTISSSSNWIMAIYKSNTSGTSACTADKNNCFQNTETAETVLSGCSGSGDLNMAYEASYSGIPYYADSTDVGSPNDATTWTSYAKVNDGSLIFEITDTWELNSTLAFDVTSSVNYGTLSLGESSTEKTIVFTNTGNRNIDANESASGNMVCNGAGSNNINISQIHYSFTSGFPWSLGTAFSTGSANFDLTLAQRTDDSAVSVKNAYLLLLVPTTGVNGACSNTITFIAKADS